MASLTGLADLSVHRIGEEGLLLDPVRQRLYALNASATLIWSELVSGCSPERAGRSLSVRYALPSGAADAYVAEILRQYKTLSGSEAARAESPPIPAEMQRHDGPITGEVARCYGLLDSVFRLHFGTTHLFERIQPLLGPFAMADGVDGAPVVDVGIRPAQEGIIVVADRQVVGGAPQLEAAAVAVRACLIQLAVARSGGFCVLHAGALRRNGAALLLPGEAGHGKSTLSAGLAAQGFEMLSDDTTLLSGEKLRVRSLPVGLCIKRGAYTVLARRLAGLGSLSEWRRPDGQWARYLRPGREIAWAAAEARAAVRWIVFPHYRPDGGTQLRPIAKHEALARLLRGVCFLSGALDAANLEKFVDWIAPIQCFELPLASLDEATAVIDGLCA